MSTLPRPIIRAVAFDMDGLMFNTEEIYDQAGNHVLQRRGIKFESDLKRKMMGLPGRAAISVMKSHHNLGDSVEELFVECESAFLHFANEHIQMMPGLESLLDEIEKIPLPKAITTSSHRKAVNFAMNRFDLEHRFDFILTAEDVKNGKPDPEIYHKAASRFDVPPFEMLVLEDSFNGTTAAVNSGALTVAIPGKFGNRAEFEHVDYVVDRLDDDVILSLLSI